MTLEKLRLSAFLFFYWPAALRKKIGLAESCFRCNEALKVKLRLNGDKWTQF